MHHTQSTQQPFFNVTELRLMGLDIGRKQGAKSGHKDCQSKILKSLAITCLQALDEPCIYELWPKKLRKAKESHLKSA
jgi:hypothetical protein